MQRQISQTKEDPEKANFEATIQESKIKWFKLRSPNFILVITLAALICICAISLYYKSTNDSILLDNLSSSNSKSYESLRSLSTYNPSYIVGTLGPLTDITNWTQFAQDLARLKANGHTYISTDIWWGQVQPTSATSFTWTYYQTLASYIQASGLKWIPILSTHSSTGAYMVPSWVNQSAAESYTSIYGTVCGPGCSDYVLTPWYSGSNGNTYALYNAFYTSFVSTFGAQYSTTIIRIDISGGPSGELRYPSYTTDNWAYPSRGQLMVYNSAAITAFQNYVIAKYSNLAGVNTAWGTSITSTSQITPPCDTQSGTISTGVCAGSSSNTFFSNTGGSGSVYGQDFLTWYQSVLITHAQNIYTQISSAIKGVLSVPIGIKIAALHWLYSKDENGNNFPHTAEYCAGYYNVDSYAALISALNTQGYQIALTGTEISDACNTYNAYSCDQTLSGAFFQQCISQHATCNAENANSISDSQGDVEYGNERSIVYNNSVNGLSILRYSDMTEDTTLLRMFQQYISPATISTTNAVIWFFITNPTSSTSTLGTNPGDNLYITGNFNNWATTSGALALTSVPSLCVGSYCPWVGQLVIPNGLNAQIQFQLIKVTSSNTVCWESDVSGVNHTLTPTTIVTNVFINAAGNGYGLPSNLSFVTQTALNGVTLQC